MVAFVKNREEEKVYKSAFLSFGDTLKSYCDGLGMHI